MIVGLIFTGEGRDVGFETGFCGVRRRVARGGFGVVTFLL